MGHQSDTLDESLTRASLAYRELRLDEAEAAYQAVADLDPDNYQAYLGLARTYTRMRLPDKARAAAERCIEIDRGRHEGYAALGVLLFLIDENQEASEMLQEAIRIAPEDPEAHITLAQVWADMADNERSQNELNIAYRAIEWIENEEERRAMFALYWHGATYQRIAQGKNHEAREAAQEAIALQDANPYAACLAYSNLGILEARERNYDRAIEYLGQAYEMNPFFYRAGSALGRLYIMRNQPARAVEVLGDVLEKTPADEQTGTRYAYALALNRAGQREEAREQYGLALEGGLRGFDKLMARWQTLWLTPTIRNIIVLAAVAAVVAWLVLVQPSANTITFVGLMALIVILQRVFGRRRG
ncbi:MAG TPA: tetratricopeptide repeat protein [Chloroflexi bacterium]|jgi:tetratricopeptide (TPR) repeat protein|nr:tetratricopeptide repeat protein [Chloroflexota bacterium]